MTITAINANTAVPNTETVRVGQDYIRGFLQGALLHGFQPLDILQKAGIPPQVYTDPTASIDGQQFQQLIYTLQTEMNDVFMGFLAQPAKPEFEGEQSRIRFQCGTLGELIRLSTQFREAVRNDIHYDYSSDDTRKEFSLGIDYELIDGVDPHPFYWHRLMQVYKYYCWLIGKRIKLNHVDFSFPAPTPHHPLPGGFVSGTDSFSIFNCEVRFNQPSNALCFDKNYLHFPVIRTAAEQIDLVNNYPDWFTIPGQDRSYTRQIEEILISLQHQQRWSPTITEVAKALKASPRTLRRQLARENESFQSIRSRLRSEVAIKLVLTTDLPVTVISAQVGYAEPGDFTRAFLRWTNETPSHYRAKYTHDKSQLTAFNLGHPAHD